MNTKQCFKCGQIKAIDEFYKHPQMADGHLGKCIECSKKYIREYTKEKMLDLDWRLKERERQRLKERRRRELGLESPTKTESRLAWQERNAKKRKAHIIVGNAIRDGRLQRQPCFCGAKAHAHHDDYSKPLDVRWLCPKHHAEHHYQQRTEQIIKQHQ